MKRVSVLGAGGMAGHVVSMYLSEAGGYRVQNISHSIKLNKDWILADVERRDSVSDEIEKFCPDVVINCVGLLVKDSEHNPGMAAYVNGYFPHFLERLGRRHGFRLIHLSTDCVFSGDKGEYSETDFRDGRGFYAQSKAMGEIVNSKDLTIRTSIIGPELKDNASGLFHWLMNSKGPVKGFARVYWNGITTLELAKSIEKLLLENISGLFHLATSKKVSKYELICMLRDVWGKKEVKILKDSKTLCDKTLVPTRVDILPGLPSYTQQLQELKQWMTTHWKLYRRYS